MVVRGDARQEGGTAVKKNRHVTVRGEVDMYVSQTSRQNMAKKKQNNRVSFA